MKKALLLCVFITLSILAFACGPDSFDSLYEGMASQSKARELPPYTGDLIFAKFVGGLIALYFGELLWRKYNYG